MKEMRNWDLFRIIRLGIGVVILIQALITKDITSGLIGAMFTAMPIFNMGCCSTMGCSPSRTSHKVDTDEISFEEIK